MSETRYARTRYSMYPPTSNNGRAQRIGDVTNVVKQTNGDPNTIGRLLRRVAKAGLSVTTLVLAACGPANQSPAPNAPPPPAGWPQQLADFTVTWSAESGIDLTSGAAVVAQAYGESYLLADVTGDTNYLYPGFAESVDANQPDNPSPGTQRLWPKPSTNKAAWVGTEHAHILSVTRSGNDITAVVCEYFYASAKFHSHSRDYEVNRGNAFGAAAGIEPTQIIMSAPAGAQTPLPVQRGPSRTPRRNVFDGWRITHHQGGYFALGASESEWPGYQQVLDTCVDKAPDPPERRHLLVTGNNLGRSDFPTLPPHPGWPEA